MSTRRTDFELNLTTVLRARDRRAADPTGATLPAGVLEAAVEACLAAVRPRDRWPENTRLYAVLRAQLGERPYRAFLAVGAAAAALFAVLGPRALSWLDPLLRSPF